MYAKIITSLKFEVVANRSAKLPYLWMSEVLDKIIEEGANVYEHYGIEFDHLLV